MEDKEPIVCTLCSDTIDEGDERTFANGDIACENCTVWCEACEQLSSIDDSVNDGSNYYCSDCGKYCERCNNAFSGDDYYVDDESWCEYRY